MKKVFWFFLLFAVFPETVLDGIVFSLAGVVRCTIRSRIRSRFKFHVFFAGEKWMSLRFVYLLLTAARLWSIFTCLICFHFFIFLDFHFGGAARFRFSLEKSLEWWCFRCCCCCFGLSIWFWWLLFRWTFFGRCLFRRFSLFWCALFLLRWQNFGFHVRIRWFAFWWRWSFGKKSTCK